MIQKLSILMSISKLRLISLLVLLTAAVGMQAQMKFFSLQKDSVPIFRGFAVSVDLAGIGQLMLSDRGQYEGALRLNLHDEWFPIVEAGVGKADHNDEVTQIHYKTSAPYFKIGIDKNLLNEKHGKNRLYGGIRYAFTTYEVDIVRDNFEDPVWQWDTGYGLKDVACKYHWVEAVVGIDAQVFGPLHLGWSVRYKQRVYHSEDLNGKVWYVPGFGLYDSSTLSATFNLIIDI